MSNTYAGPLDRLERGLDELAAISPEFRSAAEKQELLTLISRLITRAQAQRLRVLAASDDIAIATGDRSTADLVGDPDQRGARDRTPARGVGCRPRVEVEPDLRSAGCRRPEPGPGAA